VLIAGESIRSYPGLQGGAVTPERGPCEPILRCRSGAGQGVSQRHDGSGRGSTPGGEETLPRWSLTYPPAGMKPFSDEVRRMPPFGSPKGDGQYDSNEAKRRRRSVVRLIHPTAEPMPVSTDGGVRGITRHPGFGGTWMARYR